jgi:hypothetical protein
MSGQPSEVVAIDFWTLVPDVLKRVVGSRTSGQFVVRDETIALVRKKLPSRSAGSYYAQFSLPSDDRDFATGTLFLGYEEWELLKLILLVGRPTGFGEYRWRGVCPTILKPVQMLYLDPATQLFVSREAVGKPAPESVKRVDDDKVVVGKLIEKYGLSGQPHPDLEEDPDFAPFKSLAHIIADVLFASNGLPSPVLGEFGATKVLATIQNPKDRQRLPARLLKENMARKLMPPIRTIEELRAEFRRRRLPDPGEDFFNEEKSRFGRS